MRKLEIGPHETRRTPDGADSASWDTLDVAYQATHRAKWGSERLPIKDSAYDWVHASHVLEHLPWWKTLSALAEVYRILKPDGRVTLWVPDAMKIIRMYEQDSEQFKNLESGWACGGLNPDKDPWVYLNARIFWGARPGELGQEQHFHRAMFGEQSLRTLLVKVGFVNVGRIERDTAVDPGHGWMEIGMEGFR
jgi:SAM-dependent methyltransferase